MVHYLNLDFQIINDMGAEYDSVMEDHYKNITEGLDAQWKEFLRLDKEV